ncbi:MAG: O-antigen ligase family protein [Bacteroidales bacterium]|nr:O-antigen ligase family protein [Bacteroidales bacterium]
MESNGALQARFQETIDGNSSGRDAIYSNILDNFFKTDSPKQILFGNGFASSPIVTGGRYAHNDWLEILCGQGILGVILYALFFLFVFQYTFKKSLTRNERYAALSIFVIWLLKSLFSMGYVDIQTLPLTILLGYIIGVNDNKPNETQLA